MLHGLTSILSAFFDRQSTEKEHFRGQRRKLRAEQLEPRFALSTLTGNVPSPDSPPLGGPPAGNPADVDPPLTDPPSPDPPPTNPPVDPMGGPTNVPPQIINFVFAIDGGWCTLRGQVIDDQDPTGHPVELCGLIFGAPTVELDDYFTYRFELTPEMNGTI